MHFTNDKIERINLFYGKTIISECMIGLTQNMQIVTSQDSILKIRKKKE